MSVPVRELELWHAWEVEADRLGLPAGDGSDFAGLLGTQRPPFRPATVAAVLDRAVARARKRLPRYRVDPGSLAIVGNPAGSRNNLAECVDELRALTEARYRAAAVAELRAEAAVDRLPATRVAARWGISRSTLFRWSAEAGGVAISPADATRDPPIVADNVVSEAGTSGLPRHTTEAA